MIKITDKAAKHLKKLLERSPVTNEESGVRLAVSSGGCSGFTYLPLVVYARPTESDSVFESNGIRIFVDPKTLAVVDGTEIDHSDNLLGGFTFNNPKARSGCGCGASFEVK